MRDFLRVLITGGSGFLGRHIAERLAARGDLVSAFDLVAAPQLVGVRNVTVT
jgi:nucleoside-diphosphate-sugar epimerase